MQNDKKKPYDDNLPENEPIAVGEETDDTGSNPDKPRPTPPPSQVEPEDED